MKFLATSKKKHVVGRVSHVSLIMAGLQRLGRGSYIFSKTPGGSSPSMQILLRCERLENLLRVSRYAHPLYARTKHMYVCVDRRVYPQSKVHFFSLGTPPSLSRVSCIMSHVSSSCLTDIVLCSWRFKSQSTMLPCSCIRWLWLSLLYTT